MDHVNNAVYADWLDEQVHRGRRGRPPSARSHAWPASSTRAPPKPARRSSPSSWRDEDGGWSCRIADAAGADLLRARLERIATRDDDEGRSST